MSAVANPATVQAGTPSTITATGQSPDNRPLTYNFTATGGRIAPSGAQATLDTAGASAGSITVNCTATDDRGLSGRRLFCGRTVTPSLSPISRQISTICALCAPLGYAIAVGVTPAISRRSS